MPLVTSKHIKDSILGMNNLCGREAHDGLGGLVYRPDVVGPMPRPCGAPPLSRIGLTALRPCGAPPLSRIEGAHYITKSFQSVVKDRKLD
ncbi:hypothetical protein EZV62_016798 [Acer yangbiense]|uniref:Uncharacterized protein n=1 Tax=Acer yangbiense TaxID=1000413 RepID=A0A5C7HQ63_9ROSI|nr:hypothetical protein EZV62_016798 [Acer yangbiense]